MTNEGDAEKEAIMDREKRKEKKLSVSFVCSDTKLQF
jgi:hypothetical protein